MLDKKARTNLLKIIPVTIVLIVLILAGPVSAITVSVTTNKSTYYGADDSTITITGTINIENNEILNITQFIVQIKNSTDSLIKNCTVSTNGAVSNCNNITTSITYNANYQNGTRYGYGYGSATGNSPYLTANQTFGYGYGYAATSGLTNEVVVTIVWNISADSNSALADDYEANILVKSEGGGNTRYYFDQTSATFTIQSGSAPTTPTGGGGTSSTSTTEEVIEEETCNEDWICSDWEPEKCPSSKKQTRKCEDWNDCGTTSLKPDETRACDYKAPIKEIVIQKEEEPAPEPEITEEKEPIPLGFGIISIVILAGIILVTTIYIKKKKRRKHF